MASYPDVGLPLPPFNGNSWRRVRAVLTRAREHGITLSAKKFVFGAESVDFCGYQVSEDGWVVDDAKVSAIADFPMPPNRTDLRSFMCLVNQVSEFTPKLAELIAPLRGILKTSNELTSRRSRPSVSKVISQPRSLGGRRPVDRAAGAALRLIDLTPELTIFFFFCLLRSNDRTKTGVCLLSFLLRSLRLTKIVLKPKKKGHASALPASVAGSSCLSSSKVKNKDRWTTNGIDRTVSVEHTERPSSLLN